MPRPLRRPDSRPYWGHLSTLGGEIIGVGMVGGGYVVLVASIAAAALTLGQADVEAQATTGVALIIGGAIVYLGIKVVGIIRPIVFANNYNRKLQGVTQVDAPELVLTSVHDDPALMLRIRY